MVSFQMHCKISSLRAFSSALLLLLPHLGVVLHIEHSRVGGLDVVAVDHLHQLEVEEGQKLLSDVDGYWLGGLNQVSLVLVQELALGVACGCRWPCPRPPGGCWVGGW